MTFSRRQLEPLIEKFGINIETNTLFKKIIEMFDGQTNYQIWAVKAVFSQRIDMDKLEKIVEFIKEYPTSIKLLEKKNITSYTSLLDIEHLMGEISSIKSLVFVKSVIANFNTEQRKMLTKEVVEPLSKPIEALSNSKFKQWYEVLYKFNKLPWARKDKFFKTASAVRNIGNLFHQICTCLEETYSWDLGKEDLINFMENNAKDCEVVFDEDNVIIVKVPSFESSVKLCGGGRTQWCISRDEGNFNSYCRDSEGKRSQYFLFDFSRKESDVFSHIGFTTLKGHGVIEAQTGNNMPMLKEKYKQKTEAYNIHDIFKKFNVPMAIILGLKKNANFSWDIDSFLNYIKHKYPHISIHLLGDKKVVIKMDNGAQTAFEQLISTTNINKGIYRDSGSCIYYNFGLSWDDNDAVIAFNSREDEYGEITIAEIYNHYGVELGVDKLNEIAKADMEDILFKSKLDSNVLLHKYIDTKQEEKAIALILEDKADVNFEFKYRTPVFSALANGMVHLFDSIVKNEKFDDSVVDGLGESLLHTLIILLGSKDCHNVVTGGKGTLISAINSILESNYYDYNQVDANGDTPIKLSCRWKETAWITQRLASKMEVNVNYGGDDEESPLLCALRFKNQACIEALLQRPDLSISDKEGNALKKLFPLERIPQVATSGVQSANYHTLFAI